MSPTFFKRLHFSNLLFLLLALTLSSCVTQRKLEYLQHNKKEQAGLVSHYQDYKLKPNDELYIQISSLDDVSANIFSNSGNQYLGSLNAYGASLISYAIDKEGFLELPVIGKLQAKDLTVQELTFLIKNSLVNVLNQPVISVKLVNRYVSVLGEVRNPGHFVYSQDKLTVFDAIGLAGDINEYGNRKSVLLIRNINNSNKRYELNLLKADLLSSDFYYLSPGDILYVKPLRSKFWGLRQFPMGAFLTSISTAILILNYIELK